MDRPLLYIDLDGVVLVRDGSRYGSRVADFAEEFLAWAVDHFQARWLSTRTQSGNFEEVRRAFRLAGLIAGSPTWGVIERIPIVKWGVSKARAIDLQTDSWWWVDDNPTLEDLDLLLRHGRLERLIQIPANNPKALRDAQARLVEGSV